MQRKLHKLFTHLFAKHMVLIKIWDMKDMIIFSLQHCERTLVFLLLDGNKKSALKVKRITLAHRKRYDSPIQDLSVD